MESAGAARAAGESRGRFGTARRLASAGRTRARTQGASRRRDYSPPLCSASEAEAVSNSGSTPRRSCNGR